MMLVLKKKSVEIFVDFFNKSFEENEERKQKVNKINFKECTLLCFAFSVEKIM